MKAQEIESLFEFDATVARGVSTLHGFCLQSVDLTDRGVQLAQVDVAGAIFLGCDFAASGVGCEDDVRDRGGLVFPDVPDVPVDIHRASLYSPGELYAGLDQGYAATPDAVAYGWSRGPRTVEHTLAASLHDHAIDDALDEWVDGRDVVGVMGGHALRRDDPAFLDAALLGHDLAAAYTVATGGGPGAMEAANLGARLARAPRDDVSAAVAGVATVPDFAGDLTTWAQAAFEVLDRWPLGADSLGVPTWYYGHEPPNAFASVIAKYFRNALREDVLLRVCNAGIVFLPGAAGTVQEIFQSACTNYYAQPERVVPMVLVGREHWTRDLPVAGLLRALGADRAFGEHVHLVDSPHDVPAVLAG